MCLRSRRLTNRRTATHRLPGQQHQQQQQQLRGQGRPATTCPAQSRVGPLHSKGWVGKGGVRAHTENQSRVFLDLVAVRAGVGTVPWVDTEKAPYRRVQRDVTDSFVPRREGRGTRQAGGSACVSDRLEGGALTHGRGGRGRGGEQKAYVRVGYSREVHGRGGRERKGMGSGGAVRQGGVR